MKRELAVASLEACPDRPSPVLAVEAQPHWARRLLPKVLALLLVAAVLAPQPAAAAAPLLLRVGWWFGSYFLAKELDKALGYDLETQLKKREKELSGGGGDGSVEGELRLVQSQLKTLQQVLYGNLSPQEAADLQRRVQRELPEIQRVLAQQGRDVRDLQDRLEALELRFTMPEFADRAPVYIDAFTSGTRQLPASVIDSARDVLAGELSYHPKVSLVDRLSRVDSRITGHVARYSVDERTYSGYGTRPRSTIFHTLELSVSLTDPSGERIYWTKRYRRETREFLSAGNWGTSNDFGVAHELFSNAMRAAAGDVLAFIFVEEPPPEGEEYVELDR